jgi:hypothetical protein
MKKFTFLLLIFSCFIYPLYAQYVNVKISSVVYGEEWISINPKNTNQMVVGVIGDYGTQNSIMGYYYSSNSGLNWNGGPILSTLGEPGSDPVMLVDTAGNFYYICCDNWGVPGPNLNAFFCFKSTNGGQNWDNGTLLAQLFPQMDDMPMGCVDFSNSIYGNNIYVTWTLYDTMGSHNPVDSSYVYFTSSTNAGVTFTTPKRVSRIAGHGYYDNTCPEGPVPGTGTNGEVYVCFPHSEQVFFNRSTDAGNTWLANDILVSTQPGGWYGTHSPVVTCDLSNSAYRGNVYICFSDLRNGVNDRDIWFVKSTNRGDNWSNPLRVNNDGPGNLQELPWICVDRVTGYIWIIFYDTRGHNQYYADVYVARSTDGGNTFQNSKVSNSSSPTTGWYGDYIGISAYNNMVRPVWTKNLYPSLNELWTAIIDTFIIGIKPISSEIPDKFTLSQNYPNPFNPTTKIKFSIPATPLSVENGEGLGVRNVQLIIYDILGRQVATLVNEKLSPGTYEVEFDGSNYASGVYFYKLTTESFSNTKRMVLLK